MIKSVNNPLMIRPSSQIRRCLREGVPVFEKQYMPDDWGGDSFVIRKRAERECQLIEAIDQSGRFGRRLGTVKIAECDPKQARITTFEISGQSLEQWLGGKHKATLYPWFVAGRWLRVFQALPLLGSASEQLTDRDPMDAVEYCDLRLRSLADYGYCWPHSKTREKLLSTIQTINQTICNAEQQSVWTHADYAPGNLMWGDGVLTPIDFAMAQAGGPLDDATYLIHRLEMHRVYRPWRRLPVTRYRQAILRGLGCPEAAESPAYRLAMIKHLICRLHTYVRRPPRDLRQSVHDRWVRQVLQWRLRRAMTDQAVNGNS